MRIMENQKKQKNPWIAAVLNFILPGLGYIYVGKKRKVFAFGLFALSIWVGIHDRQEILSLLSGKMSLFEISEHFLIFILLYPLVFAWDAFMDAGE